MPSRSRSTVATMLACVAFVILTLTAGCGGGSTGATFTVADAATTPTATPTSTPSASPSPTPSPSPSPTPTPTLSSFLYCANNGSNNITTFNQSSDAGEIWQIPEGTITPTAGSPLALINGGDVNPYFLVLSGTTSGVAGIQTYRVNAATSAWTSLGTYDAGGQILSGALCKYTGYLYVLVNRGGVAVIRGFKVNADGTLVTPGFDAATGGNLRLAAHPQVQAIVFSQGQIATDAVVVSLDDLAAGNLLSFTQVAATGVLTEAGQVSLAEAPVALSQYPGYYTPGVTINTTSLYVSTASGANGAVNAYLLDIAGAFTPAPGKALAGAGSKLRLVDNTIVHALLSAGSGTSSQLQMFAVADDGALGAQLGATLSVGTGTEHVTCLGTSPDALWLYVGTDANRIHVFGLDDVTLAPTASTLPSVSCGGTLPVFMESVNYIPF